MFRLLRRRGVATLLLVAASAAAAGAQPAPEPPAAVAAFRLLPDERITLDGRLSEEAWRRAVPASGFRQQEPQNGEPATEATEVRVLFDQGRIVLGIICFDAEPDRVAANQMQRDQSLTADDRFMVAIDTYSDGRTGYYFEINPAGAMGDGLVLPGNGISVNRSWDGIWDARVQRTAEGWSAEIDIPLRTINFEAGATSWGINFQRTVRRKSEESLWTGWARNQGLTYMAAAGRLDGLTGLTQGLGLDLLPYALGRTEAAPGRGAPASRQELAVGGDIAYNLTPALRANVSVNTDFAETEVDQRQVNLTRFPLFFPEKRAFFLEGANLFDFAREPGNAIVPFFSRRIGLDAAGAPQPIDVGVKLTGQAGRFDVGVLQVRTRDRDAVPGEHFTVARVRRRLWQQSYVGGLVTSRSEGDAAARQTAGVDAVLSTSTFLDRQVLEVSAFYLTTTGLARRGAAYGARINFPNDPLNMRLSVREVQDGYDPAVGFVDRRGYRLIHPGVRRIVHTERHPVFRRFSFEADLNFTFDTRGVLETRRPDLQLIRVDLQSSDILEFHLLPMYERLPREFAISPGVILPAGREYRFLRRRAVVTSATKRPVSIVATYEDGAFYSGTRRQVNGTLAVRPRRGWLVNVGADYNQVALAEGRFVTRLWLTDVNTQLNPFVSFVHRVQFDTVTRQLGWQARFRWITRPGDDVFVVYTQNWREDGALETLDRRGAVKIVRTLRF